jgi:hypothetical protein
LHDTFGSFRERHARFSMLFIASIPLPTRDSGGKYLAR